MFFSKQRWSTHRGTSHIFYLCVFWTEWVEFWLVVAWRESTALCICYIVGHDVSNIRGFDSYTPAPDAIPGSSNDQDQ